MEQHNDENILTWKEARIDVYNYFNFFIDGEDRLWAKKMWKILEYVGLTKISEGNIEVVHLRIALLALIYQEFCERCGYGDATSIKGLKEQHYKNIFKTSTDTVNDEIYKIIRALTDYYGEEVMFKIAYESMYRGLSDSCFEWQVSQVMNEVMEAVQTFGHTEQRAYRFLADSDEVAYFESCSGLGYF